MWARIANCYCDATSAIRMSIAFILPVCCYYCNNAIHNFTVWRLTSWVGTHVVYFLYGHILRKVLHIGETSLERITSAGTTTKLLSRKGPVLEHDCPHVTQPKNRPAGRPGDRFTVITTAAVFCCEPQAYFMSHSSGNSEALHA